jgi:hypothetical protein
MPKPSILAIARKNNQFNNETTNKLVNCLMNVVKQKNLTNLQLNNHSISKILKTLLKNKDIKSIKNEKLLHFDNFKKNELLFLTNVFCFLYILFQSKNIWNISSIIDENNNNIDDLELPGQRRFFFLKFKLFFIL